MWNPYLPAAFLTLVSGWQHFVSRRLQEDFYLMHRLTQGRTPDQVMSAYTEYWQKAAEDYGKELTIIADVIKRTAVATQSAAHEVSTPLFSPRKASVEPPAMRATMPTSNPHTSRNDFRDNRGRL
jgi:hypothetical protein